MSVSVYEANFDFYDGGIYHPTKGYHRWVGRSFNPTSNRNIPSNSWDFWADNNAGLADGYNWGGIWSPVTNTNFVLTNYQHGNECLFGLCVMEWANDDPVSHNVSQLFTIKNPDNINLYSVAYNFRIQANWSGYRTWTWIGLGIKPPGWGEISKNGMYSMIFTWKEDSGAWNTYPVPKWINMIDFPSTPTRYGYQGYIWVDGEDLVYVSYYGWEIRPKNDGGIYGYAPESNRNVCMDSTGKITWVGESGNVYRTALGDRYGYGGWTSPVPSNPGSSHNRNIALGGSSSDWNDSYLYIVSNGALYRIGAGDVYSPYQ